MRRALVASRPLFPRVTMPRNAYYHAKAHGYRRRAYSTRSYNRDEYGSDDFAPTRENLQRMLLDFQKEHGSSNPSKALLKTNTKYLKLKGTRFGETHEGETAAVEGMMRLLETHKEHLKGTSYGDHYAVQEADRAHHQGVIENPMHPYGPMTTALTKLMPTHLRAMYSMGTQHVPTHEELKTMWGLGGGSSE